MVKASTRRHHLFLAVFPVSLVALLATASLAPVAVAQTSSADAMEARGFLDAGKQAFGAKDYSRAAGLFQKAFAKDPTLGIALYNQAFALKKAKKLAQARDVYDAYTRLNPNDADGYYGLADVYRLLGNEKEAAATFTIYLAKETRASKSRYVAFARDYIEEAGLGAPSSSKGSTSSERQTKKSADQLYVEAGKAYAAKRYSEAAATYSTVYELDPRRHQALLKMGLALRKDKQLGAAAESYAKFMQVEPGDFDGMFGLAETRRLMNQPREAATLFKKYIAREERASRRKYRAYAAKQLEILKPIVAALPAEGSRAQASKILPVKKRSSAEMKREAERAGLLQKAKRLYAAKDYVAAAQAYDDVWKFDPTDPAPLHKKALSLRKAKDYPAARSIYQNLASRDRNDLDALFGLGETLRLEGNSKRSIKVFTTYLSKEKRPKRKSYVAYARKQLASLGGESIESPAVEVAATKTTATKTAEKKSAEKKSAEKKSVEPTVAKSETTTTAKKKETNEATSGQRKESNAVVVDHSKAAKLMVIGQRAYKDKRYPAAVDAFREALRFNPDLDDAILKEALALRKAKRYDEARDAYLRFQTRQPENLDALFGIAETDRLAGRMRSALALFRRYAAEEKRTRRASYVKYAKSTIEKLAASTTEDPAASKALAAEGNKFYREKEFGRAADKFGAALEVAPKAAAAENKRLAHRQALSLRKANRLADAVVAYDGLLSEDVNDLDAVFGRAETRRLQENTPQALLGFRDYIAREKRGQRKKYVAYAEAKVRSLLALRDSQASQVEDEENKNLVALGSSDDGKRAPGVSRASAASPSERHAPKLARAVAAQTLVDRAQDAVEHGDIDGARTLLLLAIARSPRNHRAHLALGKVHDKLGQKEKARENYTHVLKLAAGTPSGDAAEALLHGEIPTKRFVRAPSLARELTVAEQERVQNEIAAAQGALDANDGKGAVNILEATVRLDRENYQAWMLLGDSYLSNKSAEQAVASFQRAAFLNSESAAPLWGLARAHAEAGHSDRATRFYAQYAKSVARDVDDDKRARADNIAQGLDYNRPWIRR